MFQHRHMAEIAATLAKLPFRGHNAHDLAVEAFADMLQASNPKFDRARFMAAAAGKPTHKADVK